MHRLTDVPLLKPEHYSALLAMLVDEVKNHGFSRAETVRNIEDRCEDEGLPISAAQIGFVVEAVNRGGLSLSSGKPDAGLDVKKARAAFMRRVVELCKLSQLTLDAGELSLIQEWLQVDKQAV